MRARVRPAKSERRREREKGRKRGREGENTDIVIEKDERFDFLSRVSESVSIQINAGRFYRT